MTTFDPLSEFDAALDDELDPDYLASLVNDPRSRRDGTVVAQKPAISTRRPNSITVDDLLAEGEPGYDWLVPGLLERGDRLILTGLEGKGKSTLLRQMGMQCAAGIHPFGGDAFDPLKVLIFDCENSKRQVARKIPRLREAAGRGDLVKFEFRTDGMAINTNEDAWWLEECIQADEPDIVIIGPVYKIARGNPKDEEAALATSSTLDRLRVEYGFTLLIEAHTPYAEGAKGKRPIRPYGASLWSRWPEFGIFIDENGKFEHWRGQREERAWPTKLMRGVLWPWEVDLEGKASGPQVADDQTLSVVMANVYQLLMEATPVEMNTTELVKQLKLAGKGARPANVGRAAQQLAADRDILVRHAGQEKIYRWLPNLLDQEEF